MDSGDSQQFSQSNFSDTFNNPPSFTNASFHSENSSSFKDLEESQNGANPSNLQQHRVLHNNPFNGHFLPKPHQLYGPNFSYQSLLNTPNIFYVGASSQSANSQPSKVPPTKTKNPQNPSTTNRRWTLAEDVALVNARLHVSCDADVGIGQKSEALWSRILQVWRQNMGNFDVARNSNSLECRWGTLQASINIFHGIYERLERNPKSGTSVDDMKREALRFYQESNKNKPFKHIECWEICRKNVKWCTGQLTKQDSSKRQKLAVDGNEDSSISKEAQTYPNQYSGSPSTPINLDADPKSIEVENAIHEVIARPSEGRKAVKEQKKKMAAEKGVVDALGNLQSCLEKQIEFNKTVFSSEIKLKERDQLMKERNQLMKEKAQKRRDQERVLLTNLSELSPIVRSAYEIMQANILKEWEEDGVLGQHVNGSDN